MSETGLKIWLDDVREIPENFDLWVKNPLNMIGHILSENVSFLSFDHDLGNDIYDGYWLAKFIEGLAFDNRVSRIGWEVHSQNPVGRKNIEMAMNNADKFWALAENGE